MHITKLPVKFFVTIGLVVAMLHCNAQNKNVWNIAGWYYDYLLVADDVEDDPVRYANKTGFSCGYGRLIGSRIYIGLNYNRFFGPKERESAFFEEYDPKSDDIGIRLPPNFTVTDYYLKERGQGFTYESKYFFDDHDNNGPDGVYIGVMFSKLWFEETLKGIEIKNDITFEDYNYPDITNKYTIKRIGAKCGAAAEFGEYYIGTFYNFENNKGAAFNSPTRVSKLSLTFGFNFWLPF